MPHEEINENGRKSLHPGYELRICHACGKEFLIAITSKDILCGRKSCNEKGRGGVATKEESPPSES